MTQENQGLGQALNKAVEIGISSQLDQVKDLNVDIKTDPLKLVQGQVDEVTVEGKGLVMQKDLRITELDMHMSSVAVNPLSAALGKIELTQPTDASVHAVLTEADIDRAFNSDFVRRKLHNLKINVKGKPTKIDAQHVDFQLPGAGKVALNAKVMLCETGSIEQVAFTAIPCISADGKTVSLEEIQYGEGKELSPELTKTLVAQVSEILNLSNFDLGGMSLRIKQLKVEAGKLTFAAEAHVEQLMS